MIATTEIMQALAREADCRPGDHHHETKRAKSERAAPAVQAVMDADGCRSQQHHARGERDPINRTRG